MRPRSLKPPLPSRPSRWLDEAQAHRLEPAAPPLAGSLEVDVAVVGGGYTGLWTALALREGEPSLSVAVLEARAIGDGPSGRNGGFLHGYWSSLAEALIEARWSGPIDVSADRLPLVDRRVRLLPPEPLRFLGGRVVRWGTLASEEACSLGRRPSVAVRAAAAIPRLLRLPIGTR